MIRLKICGMRDPGNLEQLSALAPDYVGLIFYEGSPRYVGITNEPAVINSIVAFNSRVGVFVNASLEEILDKVARFSLNYVQLHGNEPVDQCRELKKQGVGVIKVFSVADTLPPEMEEYVSHVEYFLFDTKTVDHGGSGKQFDWSILEDYKGDVPYFLSGGIGLDNVGDLGKYSLPGLFALDVNSKMEAAPGIKDMHKIIALQTVLRNINFKTSNFKH